MRHTNCIRVERMESVLADLYDVLGELRYPEISKIDVKDLAANVLAGQNRIALLSWLLSRSSETLSSHLKAFQGTSLKDEVVKCYLQMGISNDENTLLGNCSSKHHLSTLKALLLFAKSLENTENESIDESLIDKVLEKHIEETINIIPLSCRVSMRLTNNEVKKYLEEVDKTMKNQPVYPLLACEVLEIDPVANREETKADDSKDIESGETLSLESAAGAFSAAFESSEFMRNTQSPNTATRNCMNLDETVQNLYKDLSYIVQVFESKKAICATRAVKCLEKNETPLSLLIEGNVIFFEQIRMLYDQN